MTAFDRLDVLDARVSGALDEIAAPSRPDYLDDIFQVTARTRQRPRWTFLERWLPMDTAVVRPAGRFRMPIRALAILLILALLAAAAGGRLRRLAAPDPGAVRPGGQRLLAYGSGGDLYVRDSLSGAPRVLVGGAGDQGRCPVLARRPEGRL